MKIVAQALYLPGPDDELERAHLFSISGSSPRRCDA